MHQRFEWVATAILFHCAFFLPDLRADSPHAILQPKRPSALFTVRFSADSRLIAAGGFNGDVDVWNVSRGKRIAHFPAHRGPVRDLQFTKDDRLISCSGDSTVAIWNLEKSTLIRRFKAGVPHVGINAISVGMTSKVIYTVDSQYEVKRWQNPYSDGFVTPFRGVFGTWISPSGKELVTLNGKNSVVRISGETYQQNLLYKHTQSGRPIFSVSSSGRITAVLFNDQLRVFDNYDEEIHTTVGLRQINALSLSPDGKLLSLCGADRNSSVNQTSVQVLNTETQKWIPLIHKEGPEFSFSKSRKVRCYATAISQSPYLVAFAGTSGLVHVYRIRPSLPQADRSDD